MVVCANGPPSTARAWMLGDLMNLHRMCMPTASRIQTVLARTALVWGATVSAVLKAIRSCLLSDIIRCRRALCALACGSMGVPAKLWFTDVQAVQQDAPHGLQQSERGRMLRQGG